MTSVITSLANRSWRLLARHSLNRSSGWTSHPTRRATGSISAARAILTCARLPSFRAKMRFHPFQPCSSSHLSAPSQTETRGSSIPRRGSCANLVEQQASFYNEQVKALQNGADELARDPSRFKWDGTAENRAKRSILAEVRPEGFRSAIYRPFFRQHFYMDRVLNNSVYQLPNIFPTPGIRQRDRRCREGPPRTWAFARRNCRRYCYWRGPRAGASGRHVAKSSPATRMTRLHKKDQGSLLLG